MSPEEKEANSVELLHVLRKLEPLLVRSENALYSSLDVDQIRQSLGVFVRDIQRGDAIDASELRWLFAPTGPIQETAIENGWSEHYLELATSLDILLNRMFPLICDEDLSD